MQRGNTLLPILLTIVLVIVPKILLAEARTVFKGRPIYIINEFGFMREASEVDPAKAPMAEVVISEIGGKFYWASRENRELQKVIGGQPAGAIITYIALDASGYIRIVTDPSWKKNLRTRFLNYDLDYTEHMTQSLGSLTYYGKERKEN